MQVKPHIESNSGTTTISATLKWENNPYSNQEIFFRIPHEYAAEESIIHGALLLALSLPALHLGEKRLLILGPVDPIFIERAYTALAQLSVWYDYAHKEFVIESSQAALEIKTTPSKRSASFFSGGVDSFWSLTNSLNLFPHGHSQRVNDAIICYGFDMGWRENSEDLDLFRRTTKQLTENLAALGVGLLQVHTNIRRVFDDPNFWAARWHGMVLASVGYLLSGKITDIKIPGTNDLWHLDKWGSSPLIDPHLTTPYLRITHDGASKTRLEKVRLISTFPAALNSLRVCTKTHDISDENINCGVCEKCYRTKLELLACGALEKCTSFANKELDQKILSQIRPSTAYQASEYEELIDPLLKVRQKDLSDSVKKIAIDWNKYQEWVNYETPIRRLVKALNLHSNKDQRDLFKIKRREH